MKRENDRGKSEVEDRRDRERGRELVGEFWMHKLNVHKISLSLALSLVHTHTHTGFYSVE